MRAPAGTVIGFATQPNHTAKQGPPGGNSPYAEALAYFMGVKGLEIFNFFNEVGLKVMDATANEQEPWVSYSTTRGPVYFNPPEVTVGIPPTPPELQGSGHDDDFSRVLWRFAKRLVMTMLSAIQGKAYINPPEVTVGIPPTPPELQGSGHDDESSPPISSVRTSASLPFIQVAWKQLDNNEYAAARATLTKGIEADQNSAVAYSYRGFAWYLEGSTAKDPRDAYEAYRKGFPDLDMAIQLDPSYAPVRRHRGNTIVATYKALRSLRRPTNDILDRAIDDLNDAVRLDPMSEANRHFLKDACLVKRSDQPAIKNFNKDWPCNEVQVQVIEDLKLRKQPDPRARNVLGAPPDDKMPKGSQVAVIDTCRPWMGSGRGTQDADNIWCQVLYEGHRGWANAYFLADDHGERVACVMYPTARGCASMAGR